MASKLTLAKDNLRRAMELVTEAQAEGISQDETQTKRLMTAFYELWNVVMNDRDIRALQKPKVEQALRDLLTIVSDINTENGVPPKIQH